MATAFSDKTAVESTEELRTIQSNHDEAFLHVSQALSYEERMQYELAASSYKKGLEKIDKALNVRCDRPYCVGLEWDKARKMQQKMRKTVQMIKSQLDKLSTLSNPGSLYPNPSLSDIPPSYVEACGQKNFSQGRRASCPTDALKDFHISDSNGITENGVAEVEEVFYIPDGVQLFYVSSNGSVTTTSVSSSLHIYRFMKNGQSSRGTTLPSAWLQVGSWTYPLIPGQSPALESGYGAFIFPDVENEDDSAAVGIILPASVDFETRKTFEQILDDLTVFEEERSDGLPTTQTQVARSESFSDKLSQGFVTGAEYLSVGLVKGASLTGEYIQIGANMLRDRLQPDISPTVVDPRLKEGLKIVRGASSVALKASGYLVGKLGDMTLTLGRKLAPHIREQGAKLLSSTFNQNPDEAKDTVDNVLKVAAGGVQGFSTMYMGLENAARILAYSLSTEAVNIVGHKYGNDAGEVIGNAVFSVGNLALTTRNIQTLGVKSVAKRTAKDAGKAVLQDYVGENKEQTQQSK